MFCMYTVLYKSQVTPLELFIASSASSQLGYFHPRRISLMLFICLLAIPQVANLAIPMTQEFSRLTQHSKYFAGKDYLKFPSYVCWIIHIIVHICKRSAQFPHTKLHSWLQGWCRRQQTQLWPHSLDNQAKLESISQCGICFHCCDTVHFVYCFGYVLKVTRKNRRPCLVHFGHPRWPQKDP